MPREIRIYFEGDKSLKAGFDAFLQEIRERASTSHCKVWIVATGGTPERDFGIAMRKHPAAWNVLLRDSEGPLQPNRPASLAGSIFWMVEMMESRSEERPVGSDWSSDVCSSDLKASGGLERPPAR